MSSFPLRPVSDISPSPSPSSSTSPPAHSKHIMPSPSSRRPLSPGNLRDIDLSHAPDRKYAAPLTGHDLMAMFPPAPPDNFPEMRAGPTSVYFRRQERAFFAQAGEEIVRVRLEVELQNGAPDHPRDPKAAIRPSASRSWLPPNAQASPTQASSSAHHSPSSSTASGTPPALYPHPSAADGPTASPSTLSGSLASSRSSQRGAAVASTAGPGAAPSPYQLAPALHAAPPPHHPHHPHAAAHQQHPHPHTHSHSHSHGHSMRTPPHDHMQPPPPPQQQLLGGPPPPGVVPKSEFAHPPPPGMMPHPEDYEPDDAWKRPMPYAERRRAGKHTKRVIVKT